MFELLLYMMRRVERYAICEILWKFVHHLENIEEHDELHKLLSPEACLISQRAICMHLLV